MKVNQILFNLSSRPIKKSLWICIFLFAFCSLQNINVSNLRFQSVKKFDTIEYAQSVRNRSQIELIKEVDDFIKTQFPKSKLSAKNLVEKCLKYNMDITFVLSQGIIESHLGTEGIAKKTNSVWNVGTYDNGKVLYTYNHPDESVEPYLILLKDMYLIKIIKKDTIKRDINSLITDNGFYNINGHRFAVFKNYENSIRIVMVCINNKTTISAYQKIIELNDSIILNTFAPLNNKELKYLKTVKI